MTRHRARAVALAALLPLLAGCSVVDGLQTRVSTAQTCESAAGILSEMSEVTLLLATNPFGFESYSAELTVLAAELEELTPRDPELDSAIDGLAAEISGLLGALEESPPALERVPGHIADAQLMFREITTLCGVR